MGAGFVKIPRFHDNVVWLRGNHDDPAVSRKHPNYIGGGRDWGYDEANKLFWMAGAWSIDWAWRKASNDQGYPLCWWPDEELSQPELDAALALYIEKKPEIVVSHEAPASVVPHVLIKSGLTFNPEDPMYNPKYQEYRDYPPYERPEKLKCIETRTSRTLQRMLNHHEPLRWRFGHYHISKGITLGGTNFRCLAELEIEGVVL